MAKLIHLHESFLFRLENLPHRALAEGESPKVSAIWGIAPIMDLQCKQMALKGLCECCVCDGNGLLGHRLIDFRY